MRHTNLDVALSTVSKAKPMAESPSTVSFPRNSVWLQWRPLWAAAAGLVIGVFSASMVWAYAVPIANRVVNRTIAVLSEGFEDPQFTPNRRFPIEANQWSGDLVASVEAEAEVTPLEGQRMLRLTLKPSRELSHAWRIVDLADFPELAHAETRRLEVSAAFNTPGPVGVLRYRLRLAAFSQEPTALRAIWSDESVLFDTMIEQVVRNVWTKPDDRGWQTVQASLEIPPGTRSTVISLAAGATDPDQPPEIHYLDDVRARFEIMQAPVE
ncbi:MAG: hypothetical protein HC841_00800 [Verrucomicrobiae bacterium]|nr:hypothetical protein [Verrucomicrobiae bacterium]